MNIKDVFFNNKVNVYDNFPDAIIVLDFMRNITYWNKKAEILFGYSKSEIKNKNIAIIFSEDFDKFNKIIGLNHGNIIRATNKNGENFFVDVTAFDAYNSAKIIVSVRALSNKFLELQNLLDDYQTTKLLVSNRDSFLSNLKFDIITPLNAAIGFSQSLLEGACGKLTEKQEKYINIVNSNNNKMKVLLDKIFEIIDLDSDSRELKFKNFNFLKMIEFAIECKSKLINEKNLSVSVENNTKKITAYSDEYAVNEIINILLDNAIKYTTKGKIIVKILHPDIETLEFQEIKIPKGYTETAYLQVQIIDSGIGISDEDAPFLFDEYSSKNLAIAQKHGGTALSLPIAQKLVHKLNGAIFYTKNEVNGSIFNVLLPIERMSFE